MKFLEPTRKRKFIYTDLSLEFGKTSSTPNKSPQNALVGPQRTQVTTCAVFSLEAISLIKEVERNDSLDEFISLRSTAGKIAPALSKIIQNSHLKKVSLEEQKAQKGIGFYEEDRSLSWSTTTFELLALMIPCGIAPIYSLSLFATMMFGNSRQDGMGSIVYVEDPTWWRLGKSAHIEDTWVRATQEPDWNWTTWTCSKRGRCPIIRNWKQWWKGV